MSRDSVAVYLFIPEIRCILLCVLTKICIEYFSCLLFRK